jgi:hypothetical protein
MAQYSHANTDDEISHAAFINAYLKAHGAKTVNLDRFRRLPSSQASGAQQIGRLTNLMELSVDTSYWTRYRRRSARPVVHRSGWRTGLYKAASQPSAFFDVTQGSNDLAEVGCCQATAGYDLASGLGRAELGHPARPTSKARLTPVRPAGP